MEQEYRKELFSKYLDNVRPTIYEKILDSNSELIHKLYKKKKHSNLRGNPLWLLHGGELINLYSDDKNKVRTKDIDLKLYMTGDYNIPYELFTKSVKKIKKVNIHNDLEPKFILKDFKKSMGRYYNIWEMGEKQRINMCCSLLINDLNGPFSQINIKTGKLTDNKQVKDIKNSSSQKWINGDDCSAFILNIPYITQVGRDNFPYDLSDDIITSYGGYYDDNLDGYYIHEEFLDILDSYISNIHNSMTSKKVMRTHFENKVSLIRYKNQKFKLSSVVGIIIIYNKTRDELYLYQEGILDTYIDYSAGDHLTEELEYLGRYSDGSFPTIVKNVKFNNKYGVFKIPTLTWIIYDQLRMLYVVLRGQYLLCDKNKCKWTDLGGGAKDNYEKYFKKLSGLLISFNNILNNLHEGNLENITYEINKCKDTNIEKCGFSSFISTLYDNLLNKETMTIKGRSKGRSKSKGHTKGLGRSIKRRKTKKKKSKFIHDLMLKNSDINI